MENELMHLRGIVMTAANPLRKAVDRYAKPQRTDITPEKVEREIARLGETKAKLLPIERQAKHKLEQRIQELKHCTLLDARFQRIDMSFLRWRNAEGAPRFAVFTPEEGTCTFKGESRRTRHLVDGGYTRTHYRTRVSDTAACSAHVKPFQQYFKDVLAKLGRIAAASVQEKKHGKWIAELSAAFGGVIPDNVRETIQQLRTEKTFEDIYIVAEAPKWSLKKTFKAVKVRPRPRPTPAYDPLVIGQRDGYYWLVAAFDVTPVEHHVRSEFTESVKPAPE